MRFSIQELYSIFSQTYFWILIFEFAHSWFKFYLVSLWFEWLFCVSIFGLILGITFSCFFWCAGSFRSASTCGAAVCSARAAARGRSASSFACSTAAGDGGRRSTALPWAHERGEQPVEAHGSAGWPAHAATGFASRPKEVPGGPDGAVAQEQHRAGPRRRLLARVCSQVGC